MLWAHFDDSNIHDLATGHVNVTGHGGAIAPYEKWKLLEARWRVALDDEGINTFHMTDFENLKGEFTEEKGWGDEKRHKAFLLRLLEIIKNNVQTYIGYAMGAYLGEPFIAAYKDAVSKMLMRCSQEMYEYQPGEKLSVVFAKHGELSGRRITEYASACAVEMPEIESVTIATPQSCYSLQAADLLAYEFVRWRAMPDPSRARFPIRYLSAGPQPFRVLQEPGCWIPGL